MIEWFGEVAKVLRRWERLGTQAFPDGTVRIGWVPDVAPQAYLHCIPAPLGADDVATLEARIDAVFPRDLAAFYLAANGLKTFSDNLGLYGSRRSFARGDHAAAAAMPYDLFVPNRRERPRGLAPTDLVIGYYSLDGSDVVMQADGGIFRVLRDSTRVEQRWPSLETWLVTEVNRLAALFDERGACVDEALILPG